MQDPDDDLNARLRAPVSLWDVFILALAVFIFLTAIGSAEPARVADEIKVYDGDTFTLNGERIRIATIDTPELYSPHCDAEKRLAKLAKARMRQLLGNGHGLVVIRQPGKDRYGRTLATVSVGGSDVGEVLIREGLASRWEGRRHNWCCG